VAAGVQLHLEVWVNPPPQGSTGAPGLGCRTLWQPLLAWLSDVGLCPSDHSDDHWLWGQIPSDLEREAPGSNIHPHWRLVLCSACSKSCLDGETGSHRLPTGLSTTGFPGHHRPTGFLQGPCSVHSPWIVLSLDQNGAALT
jgi:hypothetical protein